MQEAKSRLSMPKRRITCPPPICERNVLSDFPECGLRRGCRSPTLAKNTLCDLIGPLNQSSLMQCIPYLHNHQMRYNFRSDSCTITRNSSFTGEGIKDFPAGTSLIMRSSRVTRDGPCATSCLANSSRWSFQPCCCINFSRHASWSLRSTFWNDFRYAQLRLRSHVHTAISTI